MFVKSAHYNDLQNEEHFGLVTYFDEIFVAADPIVLKIVAQYAGFKSLISDERKALDQVQKSDYTAQVNTYDVARDKPVLGFFKTVKGQLNHFNPAVSEAAYRINIINESFSGITRLSLEKQSSAAISYFDALDAASTDISTLLMTDWVTEMKAKESAFLVVKNQRIDEQDGKSTLNMKEVRHNVDGATTAIMDRLNAFITIDGDADYAAIVTKINNRIDIFSLAVAQRKGRKKKDDGAAGTDAKV